MSDALDLMLGVYRTPSLGRQLCHRALPGNLIEVIRLAAGDVATANAIALSTHVPAQQLREAAIFFLPQLLFDEKADSYRILGVAPDASAECVKAHYRWLMRWLHPDRHPHNDHAVFADRVTRAWNSLRTPQRRRAYDLSLSPGLLQDAVTGRGDCRRCICMTPSAGQCRCCLDAGCVACRM
ncbi:J domain-containing protein [Tahibacter amnicola]|uniref:J domain-containing protein n=1 Tax=Tahibacter amnicola TaxID=2976241 RepID=A0ABY6B9P2_9GAMM|nr:J domain-containing protein [Tahibacter amnicola]UXI66399.1 J domain-containing protein [Tahibacter amnicola]